MILTLIGARPQFVKAAVVSKAFMENGIPETIVHSGQHYDEKMSQVFWDELGIPEPQYNLNAGSGSHAVQTAKMMITLEEIINGLAQKPKAVLLYGDTNTTVAGSLVASKLHIPVIHIEAGLRSFNRKMPEEVNRVVTDHLSDLLFCPSESAVKQLEKEGVIDNVFDVGDVMYDSFITFSKIAERTVETDPAFTGATLLTLHRPVNTDDPKTLAKILAELAKIPANIIWPVHPRNRGHLASMTVPANLKLTEPFSYLEMLLVLKNAASVITDSGGLQKEAYWAQKPCLTLRNETEWIETLEGGWNKLVNVDNLAKAYNSKPSAPWKTLYGTGNASTAIAQIVKNHFNY